MAYMNQTKKKEIEPKVKEILKKYGMKGRLGVRHHSTLVLNITQGVIDFDLPRGSCQVNTYHVERQWDGVAKDFLMELVSAMNIGNHDNSDIMTDYFDVGFYININIGQWDKPYVLVK